MKAQSGPSNTWVRYWLVLLAGLTCYALSAGPVIRVYVQTQNPVLRQVSASVYRPLGIFEETPAGNALGSWIRWCCEAGSRSS